MMMVTMMKMVMTSPEPPPRKATVFLSTPLHSAKSSSSLSCQFSLSCLVISFVFRLCLCPIVLLLTAPHSVSLQDYLGGRGVKNISQKLNPSQKDDDTLCLCTQQAMQPTPYKSNNQNFHFCGNLQLRNSQDFEDGPGLDWVEGDSGSLVHNIFPHDHSLTSNHHALQQGISGEVISAIDHCHSCINSTRVFHSWNVLRYNTFFLELRFSCFLQGTKNWPSLALQILNQTKLYN